MTITCSNCGEAFESTSPKAKYCGSKCRKAAFRLRGGAQVVTLGTELERPGTAAMVRVELEAAGRAETYLGAAAVALAERIDSATAVMGFAALVKELRSTMDAALAGVERTADVVDEVKAARDRKLAG